MFNNVGFKVRCLAIINCLIGMLASIITGVVFVIQGVIAYGGGYILVGILIAVFGSLGSWIGSLTTYAIGEAAENSQSILIALKTQNRITSPTASQTIVGMGSEHTGECAICRQEKMVRECTIDKQGEKKKIDICSDCMKI